jgi:hypothetical protein
VCWTGESVILAKRKRAGAKLSLTSALSALSFEKERNMSRRIILLPVLCLLFIPLLVQAAPPTFLQRLHALDTLTSTIPAVNGDINPYGVAVVPVTMGNLVAGNILVSNFNNSMNQQGTGSTIVQISPGGLLSVFAHLDPTKLPGPCPGGVGLTTALVALRSGFVIVGSLPTSDGMSATAQAGCLIILDSGGNPIMTLSGGDINGPWDMTADDAEFAAALFVTNVLNGTVAANGNIVSQGSVLRIILSTPTGGMPSVVSSKVIASEFQERTDINALVLGPTGLGLGADGTLYVADTLQSRIAAIPNALSRTDDAHSGTTVSEGGKLNQPLGLVIAPNGNILTVNGGDGLIVETTAAGKQVDSRNIDVSNQGGGTLFGLAIAPDAKKGGVYFVDDGNNTLNILQ